MLQTFCWGGDDLKCTGQVSCWKSITLVADPKGVFTCLRGTRHNWPLTAYVDLECGTGFTINTTHAIVKHATLGKT